MTRRLSLRLGGWVLILTAASASYAHASEYTPSTQSFFSNIQPPVPAIRSNQVAKPLIGPVGRGAGVANQSIGPLRPRIDVANPPAGSMYRGAYDAKQSITPRTPGLATTTRYGARPSTLPRPGTEPGQPISGGPALSSESGGHPNDSAGGIPTRETDVPPNRWLLVRLNHAMTGRTYEVLFRFPRWSEAVFARFPAVRNRWSDTMPLSESQRAERQVEAYSPADGVVEISSDVPVPYRPWRSIPFRLVLLRSAAGPKALVTDHRFGVVSADVIEDALGMQ